MNEKLKNRIIISAFLLVLFGMFAANLLMPKQDVSLSERRLLQQFPPLSLEVIGRDHDWTDQFENYLLDQFIWRDRFRQLKAIIMFDVFRQMDNNQIFVIDQNVFKLEYQLDEDSIRKAAARINDIASVSFPDSRVFYAVIPDKAHYLAPGHGYPELDYGRLQDILDEVVQAAQAISIVDDLDLDSYFRTDIHWKQEQLSPVIDRLGTHLGFQADAAYESATLEPFYGGYYGQSALNIQPDHLTYLDNQILQQASAVDLVKQTEIAIYSPELFQSVDPYSFFLGGPVASMEITNPLYEGERELVIFRDSFGSSLAPLLIPYYSKITLIDIRYVPFGKIKDFVDPSGQDVLILYSAQLMNASYLLK
jgi:hypothetical protein